MKIVTFTLILFLFGLWGRPVRAGEFQDLSESFGTTRILAGVHNATTLDTNGISLNFWTPASEGAPAIITSLSNPHMAGADAAGNIYIADKASHAILRITTDGFIHTFAGTHVAGFNGDGPAAAASLQIVSPNGLFVFPNGTVYLLDPGNHRIRRVDTNGVMTTVVNDPEPLWDPSGRALWVSPDEQLIYYTYEFQALVVNGVTNDFSDGAVVKQWTSTNGIEVICSKSVGFRNPANLDVNPVDGKLYVTDRGEEDTNKLATGLFRIDGPDQRTRLTGNITQPPAADGQLAVNSFIDGTRGLVFRPDGSYLLAGHRDGNIWFVDTDGVLHRFLRGKGSGDVFAIANGLHTPLTSKDYFSQPRAVTLAPNDDLLVVCNDSGYVFRVRSGPPVIRSGPDLPPATFGSNVTLSVTAIAVRTLGYQWLKGGAPLPGQTNATFTLANLGASDQGDYAVTVSNFKGSVTSSAITLAILPALTQQPLPATALAGSVATFSVAALGVNTLTYQWYKAPAALLAGATDPSLVISNVSAADAGSYFVRATSALHGSVDSSLAELIVLRPPTLLVQPASVMVDLGQSAAFNAAVSGTAPLSYEWFRDGMSLPGPSGPTLAFERVQSSDAGSYRLIITNLFGAATSEVATLTIHLPNNAPRPSISISSPAALFTRVPSNTLNVAGTAGAPVGLHHVTVSTGGDAVTIPGQSNRLSWQATVALAPGLNVIRATVYDLLGRSATNARSVFYVATEPLALAVTPPDGGTVRGATNRQLLEVGKSYVLTSVPKPGFVFSNWTGGATASAPVLNFVMRSNLVLNANFVPNPFLRIKGAYNGLFITSALDHQSSGFMNLVVTDRGTFTASLLTGGRRLGFTGSFDLRGQATVIVRRPGATALTVELTADLTPGATSLTGQVRGEGFEAELAAEHAAFNATSNPATNFAGRYTVIFPGATNSAASPGGDGFGVVTVNAGGLVNFTGTLADGTPVAQRVALSQAGGWPLCAPLYRGKGSLLSAATLTNLPDADLEGEFRWIKPELAATRYYPDGFAHRAALTGSRYVAPGANKVLNVTEGLLTFSGGNLEVPFTNHVTLGAGNRITTTDGHKVTLTFGLPTGLANGAAVIPGVTKPLAFRGVVHQKQNRASGFFLGPDQSGRVTLEP